MNIVDRAATHSTYFPNRPILGGVLHSTQTDTDVTTFQSAGGWHYCIGRDGTVYRDCDEDQAAWHVRAADRWRPSWVVPCPGGLTSDVNYCTIGIEIVSGPAAQASNEPYTPAQYDSLAELIEDIESRHGSLPWVGHGEMQLDRSDPVLFDWGRLFARGAEGWTYVGALLTQEEDVKPEDLELVEAVHSTGIADAQAYRDLVTWTNEMWREHEQMAAQLQQQSSAPPASVVKVLVPAGVRVEVENQ